MTPATFDTINAVIAITFATWSLLGLVLWFFKRDSFLWLFPNADFVRCVPMLALFTFLIYLMDLAPGPKIGVYINGLFFFGFFVLTVIPTVHKKLMAFRENIVGNKIK